MVLVIVHLDMPSQSTMVGALWGGGLIRHSLPRYEGVAVSLCRHPGVALCRDRGGPNAPLSRVCVMNSVGSGLPVSNFRTAIYDFRSA